MAARRRHVAQARVRRLLSAIRAGATAFTGSGLKLRAMALTYISIFSLIPALMVAVAGVSRFVDSQRVQGTIQEFLVANLAVGARDSVTRFLEQHVFGRQEVASGLVGFGLLLASAVVLLSQVESAVNDIWAVHHRRPIVQRLVTYWALLTVGPLMAVGSVAVAIDAQAHIGAPHVVGKVALVLLTMASFTAAYVVVPATHVRLLPALGGGVIAGGSFEIAKASYAWVATHLFQFQALYGSLAAVFVFLVWLYVSWTLFLFGARLAFVLQHHRVLLDAMDEPSGAIPRELVAARALLEVAMAWKAGRPPPDAGVVADRLEAPAETVRDVLGIMEESGLVLCGKGGGLTPGRPIDKISLADIRAVFAGTAMRQPGNGTHGIVAGYLAAAEDAAAVALSGKSIGDLCQEAEAAPDGPPRLDGGVAGAPISRIPV